MIPGSANPLLLATAAAGGYSISRSVRFNSSDSAYLSRTAGSPTSSGTWTFSVWIKRATLGADTAIIGGRTGGTASQIYFKSDNTLRWFENGADFSTTAVFRDVSSWYHFVFTKSGSTSCTIYVNGVQLQQNTTSIPSTSPFNTSGAELFMGAVGLLPSGISFYAGHYFADAFFIDGQALTPTSFGEFSATTGVWMPKAYTGTYGTNGFHLDFSNNASAAALGTDSSGNGNTWTVNNLSVTAGAGNDSLVDVPTNGAQTDTGVGGEVRGNYCTLNPLDLVSTGAATANGNLDVTIGSGNSGVKGTIGAISDKYYFEAVVGGTGTNVWIGIRNTVNTQHYLYATSGLKSDISTSSSYGATTTTGDVVGVAFDSVAGSLVFYKNGVSQGTAFTGISTSETWVPFFFSNVSVSTAWSFNFGQRPFAYTAPSGFKALNTSSLPAPVITKPSTVMDVKLWTGNGSTQTISGLGFEPDMVWLKRRSATANHRIYDQIRGATKSIYTDLTDAEGTESNGLTAFTSTGFSLGDQAGHNSLNGTFVGWCWDAGNTTVTNTQGSISSQVRANASAGFSVVSWSANNAANQSIGHGLGVTPAFIIHKNRTTAGNWNCWFTGFSNDEYINLNGTGAKASTGGGLWYQTPTSSVFYVGFTGSAINSGTDAIISYCFAPVAGYSSFGSYTGNGSADGPFVYTGFRPKFIIGKRSDAANGWFMFDSARDGYNVADDYLAANASAAEATFTFADFLSNGFKLRATTSDWNGSGGTIIYAAFAENPFALNARAR